MDELEKVAAEALAVEAEDAANQPVMPGQEEPPVIDPAQEWIDLARFGADLVLAPIPELKPDWTPERVDAFGLALSRGAKYYGWTTGGVFGHPLVGIAIAAYPLAVPVVRMVKANKARRQVEQRPESPEVGAMPAESQGIQLTLGGG